MEQRSVKSDGSLVTDGFDRNTVLDFDRIDGKSAELTVSASEDVSVKCVDAPELYKNVQSDLNYIAEDVISLLSKVDVAASQEMLAQFVSDLFFALAQRRQKEKRKVRQSEGIASARERGVQFGRSRRPLPENFEECCEAWRSGSMTLRQAAQACGMPHSTFRDAVMRSERAV